MNAGREFPNHRLIENCIDYNRSLSMPKCKDAAKIQGKKMKSVKFILKRVSMKNPEFRAKPEK